MTRALLIAVLAVGACTPAVQDRAHEALNAVTAVADPAYEATVVACLGAERAALAKSADRAAWERARDRIRGVCDATVEAWELARTSQIEARKVIDSCGAADRECIGKAIEAVKVTRAAIEQAADAWTNTKPVLDEYTAGGEQ